MYISFVKSLHDYKLEILKTLVNNVLISTGKNRILFYFYTPVLSEIKESCPRIQFNDASQGLG